MTSCGGRSTSLKWIKNDLLAGGKSHDLSAQLRFSVLLMDDEINVPQRKRLKSSYL